jgi:glycine cleavage system H protein
MTPEDRFYTKEHEWLKVDGDIGTVGITDHAQDALGDVVYVEVPKVGDKVTAGQTFGTVESVKAVSELFTPASGEVLEINAGLSDAPETINKDPYGGGWMIRVRLSNKGETAKLMSAAQYDDYTKDS